MFNWYVKNKLGESLCLAKWTNSTMHLGIGKNHSCHHPNPHTVPVEEVKADPSALHNSSYKRSVRDQMLNNEKPSECDYCWSIEETEKYSDRVLMSKKLDSLPYYNDIISSNRYDPTMLEVSFSNVCNFKCAYCGPQFSSLWASEIENNGAYPTSQNYNDIYEKQILDREANPYIDAFWKYLPIMYYGLYTLRITGGEPMLSRHTKKLLNYIIENPNKKLTLVINSNLGAPKHVIADFISQLEKVQHCVKRIEIATSGESYGAKAEYVRDGLNYAQWIENCNYVLTELPKLKLSLMCAYNVLSITSFDSFIDDIVNLKKKYKRVKLSISYVRHPSFMHVSLAPKSWHYILLQSRTKLKKHFNNETVQRFDFVISEFNKDPNETQLDDFKSFIKEYDIRRSKKFLDVFSEYSCIVG
jgi:MoaA/NifB/PqqE/SkfB family radical SAM enzyme